MVGEIVFLTLLAVVSAIVVGVGYLYTDKDGNGLVYIGGIIFAVLLVKTVECLYALASKGGV